MCGICGIAVAPRSSRSVTLDRIEKMRDSMTHRGPDASGTYIGAKVGLGHRRLSIIDVAHGAQPMSSDDGRVQLVYNGEIYNHPVLFDQLQGAGVHYNTRCDTETILRMYERHGDSCGEYLRGMFAFAIWDGRDDSLLLVRDRFGVKPLYYIHLEDGTLAFGSEIKAIIESGLVAPTLNLRGVPDFLANHATSGEDTLFAGIKRLPAGHILKWHAGSIQIREYWDLSFSHHTVGRDDDLIAEYRERFVDAVRMRLMSDVPLGMFLSGGIDSASITAAMSTLVSDPIETFSVAFAEREANEFYYARLVAERYKTNHHEITVTPEQFWSSLPRLIWHEDEPLAHPSSIALYFVSKLAAERVKVVLTGEGSDETLAGYNRYRVTILNRRIAAGLDRWAPESARRTLRSAISRMGRRSRLRQRLSRTPLVLSSDLTSLYFDNFAVYSRSRQASLLSAALRENLGSVDPFKAHHCALARSDATSLLNQLLYVDTKTYLQELLMKQDQMSMAASIESRVPFLDHHLVEFAASLPEHLKLKGLTTKYVLRQSMKDMLPAEILSRRKMGFPVPISSWLRGNWRSLVDEFVLGERALIRGLFDKQALSSLAAAHFRSEENNSQRLWALINLEIWQRIFLDGEDPSSIRIAQS